MLKSMTGFGSTAIETQDIQLEVEIKSLNSKFLDISLRATKSLLPLEMELRNLLSKKLHRGKIQVSLNMQWMDASEAKREINAELFKAYAMDLKQLANESNLADGEIMKLVMNIPEVFDSQEKSINDTAKAVVFQEVEKACDKLNQFREDEGKELQKELDFYAADIMSHLKKIDAHKDSRIERMRGRLTDLINKYLSNEKQDANRLEQEVIFYIERFDITEEIVRLTGHVKYFQKELRESGSGKKLGFIAQEMGREINTIGSKANDEQIQHLVVQMKDNLEKIKEQVLNIL